MDSKVEVGVVPARVPLRARPGASVPPRTTAAVIRSITATPRRTRPARAWPGDGHGRLASASANGEPVVLWFEHDLYDQLQLIQVLDRVDGPGAVELIQSDVHLARCRRQSSRRSGPRGWDRARGAPVRH